MKGGIYAVEKPRAINPNERFGTELAGKKLDTIRKSMPHYDQMQALIGSTLSQEAAKSIQENILVLEIGTGTGFTAREIVSADKRISLVSVDNEGQMIAEAKENLQEDFEAGRIQFEKADALSFLQNVPDEHFDSIASGFAIHNFEKTYREKVLQEVYRVLKTDGVFVNADKLLPDNPEEFQQEYAWQMEMFQNAQVDEVTRKAWLDHYEFDNRPDIAIGESEMVNILEKAGFKEVEISNCHHLEVLLVAKK
ncbi:MAG: class I SAM-dependent methyltransferase [Leadbetterella sp.]|nr:class I SAM-dependent methyltransferase [Leadbetterella sp.]